MSCFSIPCITDVLSGLIYTEWSICIPVPADRVSMFVYKVLLNELIHDSCGLLWAEHQSVWTQFAVGLTIETFLWVRRVQPFSGNAGSEWYPWPSPSGPYIGLPRGAGTCPVLEVGGILHTVSLWMLVTWAMHNLYLLSHAWAREDSALPLLFIQGYNKILCSRREKKNGSQVYCFLLN